MAWQFRFVSPFGTEHPEAYARITFFALDRGSQAIRAVFNVYADAAAAKDQKLPLGQVDLQIGATENVLQPEVTNPATGEVIVPKVALPPFAELVNEQTEAGRLYDGVAKAVYALSAAHPAFAEAKAV